MQSEESDVHRSGHKVTFLQEQPTESMVVTKAGKEFGPKTSQGVSPLVMEYLCILTVEGLKKICSW